MNDHSHDGIRPSGQPAPRSTDERFATLWTDYLEGDLDAVGMRDLNAMLAADAQLVSRAADLYQLHRRLGVLAARRRDDVAASPGAGAFVDDVMRRLPGDADALAHAVMTRINPSHGVGLPQRSGWRRGGGRWHRRFIGGGLVAAAVAAMMAVRWQPPPGGPPRTPSPVASPRAGTAPGVHAGPAVPGARFASLARPRFLGRETPDRDAEVMPGVPYVLSSGLVEIAFPPGATAIIEAPAVFRVCGDDCLAVDAGRCSVHAPEGAEGFRVETPATRVIDRGTRFVVSVGETADTEVQVIEGAADVVAKRNEDRAAMSVRLSAGEAARIDEAAEIGRITPALAGGPGGYKRRLPDRLISYSASLRHPAAPPDPTMVDADPGVDTLESLLVQREGRVISYPADRLIGVEVIHFRAGGNGNNFITPGTPEWTAGMIAAGAQRRAFLETDHLLTTGCINPGGRRSPLSSDPRLAGTPDADSTPGIAFRFVQPIVNEPGPDAVVFDLQMLTDPPQGDAFHVGPLEPAAGLAWHTVFSYDIDSTSPESRLLARFRLFQLDTRPRSLADLLSTPTNGGHVLPVRARCNAVGIDLSDLGYAEGARCGGLFLQDAADDAASIDPTFIAGLPPLDDDRAATGEAAP